MNWGILSKLCLLGAIGMIVWTVWPASRCIAGNVDNEDDGVTEIHDWFYGHVEGEQDVQPSFAEQAKYCLANYPVTKRPWQPGSAILLIVGFLLFRRLSRAAYHRQIQRSQHY